jgi:O-antigen/teichoic acid export membrane protein
MSRAYADGRREEAFALCGRAERQLALVLLPLLLATTVIAGPIALLLLGDRYAGTGPVIVFATIATVCQTLTQPYRQLLNAAEKLVVGVSGHVAWFLIQASVLFVFVGRPFGISVPIEGAGAAAAALAVVGVIAGVLWRALAVRALGARLEKRFLIHIVSAGALFVPAYAFSSRPGLVSPGTTLIAATVLVSIHLLVLRLSGELGTDQLQFLRDLVPPIRSIAMFWTSRPARESE